MDMPNMDPDAFNKPDEGITIEMLDESVAIMAKYKAEYEKQKAVSNDCHSRFQEARGKLVAMLMAANKSKYHVEGIGTVSVTEKLKVRTPKGLDDKKALAAWLQTQLGDDGMHTYLSVNYQSLNSLYNQEFEAAKDRGDASNFTLPGVDAPEAEFGLNFRK